MSGYVRIHRALIGHPAFRNDAEAMAFAWMVAKAAWKPCRVRYKGHGIALQRGQLAISQRDMAHDLDRDKAWIERLWKRLKGEAMIKVGVEAGVAVITICNYANFQGFEQRREAADEAPDEADARQTQGTEQVREEEKKKTRRAAPADLPEWLPVEDWAAFRKMRKASRAGFTVEAERLTILDLDKLRGEGHCPAKVLQKAVKRSWRGVFGDEDTKASVSAVKRDAAWHEDQAGFYDKIGKPDDAAEHRRKALSIGAITGDVLKQARVA